MSGPTGGPTGSEHPAGTGGDVAPPRNDPTPASPSAPPPRTDGTWGDDRPVQPVGVTAALAGFWVRFGGALVDGLLISLVALLLTRDTAARSNVQTLLSLIYFTYFHSTAAGQSIGNLALSIRVADLDTGQPLPWTRALIRVLMSFVSAIPLGLGYFWMLWDDKNQTWHDKVARSVVVKTSASPAPGPFGRPA